MTLKRMIMSLLFAMLAIPALAGPAFTPYQKASFEAAVKSGKPVVVHVHATW